MTDTTDTHPDDRSGTGSGDTFTAAERTAMRETRRERRTRRDAGTDLADVEAKLATLTGTDATIASGFHTIAVAAGLQPRLWYGMPAYADTTGVICFTQPSTKFNTRYTTIGFSDRANLDDTTMWPTSYAVTDWDPTTAATFTALLTRACR